LVAISVATHAELAWSDDIATEDAPVLVSVSESTGAAVFRYRDRLLVVVTNDALPNGDFRLVRVSNNTVLIEHLNAAPGTPELTELQLGHSAQPAPPILRDNVYSVPSAPGESQ
jgi:hypothetical protein